MVFFFYFIIEILKNSIGGTTCQSSNALNPSVVALIWAHNYWTLWIGNDWWFVANFTSNTNSLQKKVKTNTDEKAKEQELKKDLEKQLAYLQEELAQMKTQCNHLMSALKERETRINLQEEKIDFLNLTLNRLDSPTVANEKLLIVEDRDKLYDSLEVDRNTNKIEKDISKDVTFTEVRYLWIHEWISN